jgi:hypothetical protein
MLVKIPWRLLNRTIFLLLFSSMPNWFQGILDGGQQQEEEDVN